MSKTKLLATVLMGFCLAVPFSGALAQEKDAKSALAPGLEASKDAGTMNAPAPKPHSGTGLMTVIWRSGWSRPRRRRSSISRQAAAQAAWGLKIPLRRCIL